jgi:hypothetical protein
MSIFDMVTDARNQEGVLAALGVKKLQQGKDAGYFFAEAAEYRALRYEYRATADIVWPLLQERIAARWSRREQARS